MCRQKTKNKILLNNFKIAYVWLPFMDLIKDIGLSEEDADNPTLKKKNVHKHTNGWMRKKFQAWEWCTIVLLFVISDCSGQDTFPVKYGKNKNAVNYWPKWNSAYLVCICLNAEFIQ